MCECVQLCVQLDAHEYCPSLNVHASFHSPYLLAQCFKAVNAVHRACVRACVGGWVGACARSPVRTGILSQQALIASYAKEGDGFLTFNDFKRMMTVKMLQFKVDVR